jgi:hypothetical protein
MPPIRWVIVRKVIPSGSRCGGNTDTAPPIIGINTSPRPSPRTVSRRNTSSLGRSASSPLSTSVGPPIRSRPAIVGARAPNFVQRTAASGIEMIQATA